MSMAPMLSWLKSISSTAYLCPSINYLNHRHCGKAFSAPTISASVEIIPFIFSSVVSPLLTLIPWTSSLQCASCSLGVRQRMHQPTILLHSGCWPLVWAADAGYLWFIWAPSQAFPVHTSPGSLLRYIVKQCPYWCLSWTFTWQIASVPPCVGALFPDPHLVSSTHIQA